MARADRRRIWWLLAAATLVPIVVLSWLTLRVLTQDRAVETARRRDSISVRADRLALAIDRRFQEIEAPLARGEGLRFTQEGMTADSGPPILYQPSAPAADEPPASVFAGAEREEFQHGNASAAAETYRHLAQSSSPDMRAAALVRLARVLRLTGDHAGALDAYADLQRLDTVQVAGQPAALVARQGRCLVFEGRGDCEALRTEARDLATSILAGSWPIDRFTFENYGEMLAGWGAPAFPGEAIARTEAAVRLWRNWRAGELPPRGRRIVEEGAHAVLTVWDGNAEHMSAWVAATSEVEELLRPLWTDQALAVMAVDANGRHLFGEPRPASGAVSSPVALTPADTRLPFILHVAPIDAGGDDSVDRSRRTVLLGSLLAAFALMIGAAVGLYRATTRELALARQQSDFVSAVSHEFRTPLTSMRHLTDLLVSGDVSSDDRRVRYYDLLAGETERLHRMVETLLSFGRIEAGAYAWRLEPHDLHDLLSDVVEQFREDALARRRAISLDVRGGPVTVDADREALTRAVWNLLENAAKYSSAESPIHVTVTSDGERIRIEVRDQGVGIPGEERERIFQKFVRGASAEKDGVRGVGVGLALVRHIVEAHGGRIDVESELGQGSTFTIVLPGMAT